MMYEYFTLCSVLICYILLVDYINGCLFFVDVELMTDFFGNKRLYNDLYVMRILKDELKKRSTA